MPSSYLLPLRNQRCWHCCAGVARGAVAITLGQRLRYRFACSNTLQEAIFAACLALKRCEGEGVTSSVAAWRDPFIPPPHPPFLLSSHTSPSPSKLLDFPAPAQPLHPLLPCLLQAYRGFGQHLLLDGQMLCKARAAVDAEHQQKWWETHCSSHPSSRTAGCFQVE